MWFRPRELKLESLHIYVTAAKLHTLGFQAQALFDSGLSAEFDLTSRAQNPLPGQSERTVQRSRDLPRSSGESRGASYGAVGGNFAAWNFLDGSYDFFMHSVFAVTASRRRS